MMHDRRHRRKRWFVLVSLAVLALVVATAVGAGTATAGDYDPSELDGETFWIGQEHTVDLSGTAANDGDVVNLRIITERSGGSPTATRLATELGVSDGTVTIRTSRLDEGKYVLRLDGQYLDGSDFTGDLASADSVEVVRQTLTVTIGDADTTDTAVSVGDVLDGSEIVAVSRGAVTVEDTTPQVTFDSATAIAGISFAGDDIDGEVTVLDLDEEPDTAGPSPGRTVSVSSISVPDAAIDQNATIRIAVSTDRLDNLEIDTKDLQVNRYDNKSETWSGLETMLVDETADSVVLEAETPGFSLFSVSGVDSPDASMSYRSETIEVGADVTFDASASTDRYGNITRYDWCIDGEHHRGETVTAGFDGPGEYAVELTVRNDAGMTDTVRESVPVGAHETDDSDFDETGTSSTPHADESDPSRSPVDGSDQNGDEIEPDDQAFGFDPISAVVALGVFLILAGGTARRR